MLRLLIPMIAGILGSQYVQPKFYILIILSLVVSAGLLAIQRMNPFFRYRFGWLNGLFIHVLFIQLGILAVHCRDPNFRLNALTRKYREGQLLKACLTEQPAWRNGWYKSEAKVCGINSHGAIESLAGKIIVYWKTDSLQPPVRAGTQLVFTAALQPIRNSGNPASFDYARYTYAQGIFYQVHLQAAKFRVLRQNELPAVDRFLIRIRGLLLQRLSAYIPGHIESGLAAALLIGYKEDLDKQLQQSYADTGVVHIIAISGMHLALVYWLLGLLLYPFSKNRYGKWIAAGTLTTGLWVFALLAGGGASILRSAVMFSCIIAAGQWSRKTHPVNSLCVAAFLLLCVHPYWLWDAGFQLSFGAVLSIMIFMQPVYRSLYFSNKAIDGIWKMCAVSLAAQILTTPVSVYLFHQFPFYFLATNLLAIPLSSLAVLAEIALCIVGAWPLLAKPVGMLVFQLLSMLNAFIAHEQQLPGALWTGLELSVLQTVLLYLIIILCCRWLWQKRPGYLTATFPVLLLFFAARSLSFLRALALHQLVVYNIPRHTTIEWMGARRHERYSDTSFAAPGDTGDNICTAAERYYRANCDGPVAGLVGKAPAYWFNGHSLLLINKRPANAGDSWRAPLAVDIIVLSHSPALPLRELVGHYRFNWLIADASNSPARLNAWKKEAQLLHLPLFCTVDKGAFVMNTD